MTDKELQDLQVMYFFQQGIKVDIYHDESYRGIIIVHAGKPLNPLNVIKAFSY